MKLAAVFVLWAMALTLLYLFGRYWATQRRSRERILDAADTDALPILPTSDETAGFLTRWLFRAGFRDPAAPYLFLMATTVLIFLGVGGAILLSVSGLMGEAARNLAKIPGGLGDILLPIVYLGPWIWLVILASLPSLMVRAARRRRVEMVEQDLPLTLELLATLTEAGLGFDSGLQRILQAQEQNRPLAQEFRIFQLEILAGRPRIQCLRRLAWRLDVMSLTIFVSALVQSEQVGAGVSDVLRRQADDLRGRRREYALGQATAIPVKLLFPLVICFLPGILVATLGPTFYQVFQFLESITRTQRGLP